MFCAIDIVIVKRTGYLTWLDRYPAAAVNIGNMLQSVITIFYFTIFYFCCFRCVIMVIWYYKLRFFAYIYLSHNCKQPAICRTNLQLLQPAGVRLTHWQKCPKIHKYSRNYGVYFCPSAQDNSSSGVNNSSLRTQTGVFRPWFRDVRPWLCSGLGLTALQGQGQGRHQWATLPQCHSTFLT